MTTPKILRPRVGQTYEPKPRNPRARDGRMVITALHGGLFSFECESGHTGAAVVGTLDDYRLVLDPPETLAEILANLTRETERAASLAGHIEPMLVPLLSRIASELRDLPGMVRDDGPSAEALGADVLAGMSKGTKES